MREGKEGAPFTDEDFAIGPSPEEEAEASFYFFIQDVQTYFKNGKWGPRIWKCLDEETRTIIRNQVKMEMVGYDMEGSFGGYRS